MLSSKPLEVCAFHEKKTGALDGKKALNTVYLL